MPKYPASSEIAQHSEKLRYFHAIAEQGGFNAAARKMGIGAPALSIAIKVLEAAIGKELFKRGRLGVTLTPAGQVLHTYCIRHFQELSDLEHSLKNPGTPPVLRVRFGTFQSIALYFWPHLLESLMQYQNLSPSIRTGRSQALYHSLTSREIDFALSVETPGGERIERVELFKDEYAFYANRKSGITHLGADGRRVTAVLYVPDAIDRNGDSLRQLMNRWGLDFGNTFELDSMEVIAEFTKRNYGIGILPTRVARAHESELRPIKVAGTPSTRFGEHRLFLAYRNDLELSQKMLKAIIGAAKIAARDLGNADY